MNRTDKVQPAHRNFPSSVRPVLLFACLGVVALPLPPIHLHPQGIAGNVTQSITNIVPK